MGTTEIKCCKNININEERNNEVDTEKKIKIVTEGGESVNQETFSNPRYRTQMNNNVSSSIVPQDSCDLSKINKVADQAQILNIEIINSTSEPKGLTLKINPFGLVTSQRGAQDGVTYFGYDDLDSSSRKVDYVLRPKEDNYDERFVGKHFRIKFDPMDMNYYLKDLGRGFGTFIKITTWTLIKNNFLLNMGENYIVFYTGTERSFQNEEMGTSGDRNNNTLTQMGNTTTDSNSLTIKIFFGNIRHDSLTFSPSKSPFTIGRSTECDIPIDDGMLSRIHSTVQFKNGQWYIIDGQIQDNGGNKKSTNGTWIYALEDIPITEQTTFKANHNLFICSFTKQNGNPY